MEWEIEPEMFEFFGKTLEFKESKDRDYEQDYTHEYDDWFFHKLWFDDFLDKDEFMV